MSTIRSVEVLRFAVPLAAAPVDARRGAHARLAPLLARIEAEDGLVGAGHTRTGGRGGRAVEAMPRHGLAPLLTGRDAADVGALHDGMQARLRHVGRGGVASLAISAADIAPWDLRGRREGLPLRRMAGGEGRPRRPHRGGIDLDPPPERLAARAEGFDALEIEVGLPDLAEDVRRVAAPRDAIGPDMALMVDADHEPRAVEAARA